MQLTHIKVQTCNMLMHYERPGLEAPCLLQFMHPDTTGNWLCNSMKISACCRLLLEGTSHGNASSRGWRRTTCWSLSLMIILDVVRSPCTTPPSCSLATACPILTSNPCTSAQPPEGTFSLGHGFMTMRHVLVGIRDPSIQKLVRAPSPVSMLL